RAFDALRRGDLFPDDKALIRLLLGYWSTDDASVHGISVPERYRDPPAPAPPPDQTPASKIHLDLTESY
ncbi:hypothetical protein ABT030_52195, partial [Streptomyces mirabilis]